MGARDRSPCCSTYIPPTKCCQAIHDWTPQTVDLQSTDAVLQYRVCSFRYEIHPSPLVTWYHSLRRTPMKNTKHCGSLIISIVQLYGQGPIGLFTMEAMECRYIGRHIYAGTIPIRNCLCLPKHVASSKAGKIRSPFLSKTSSQLLRSDGKYGHVQCHEPLPAEVALPIMPGQYTGRAAHLSISWRSNAYSIN